MTRTLEEVLHSLAPSEDILLRDNAGTVWDIDSCLEAWEAGEAQVSEEISGLRLSSEAVLDIAEIRPVKLGGYLDSGEPLFTLVRKCPNCGHINSVERKWCEQCDGGLEPIAY
jgi:hypothetical protein